MRPPDPRAQVDNYESYLALVVVLGSIVAGALLIGTLLLLRHALKRYRAVMAAKRELERTNKQRVQRAVQQVRLHGAHAK
jgi:hypothetical protein